MSIRVCDVCSCFCALEPQGGRGQLCPRCCGRLRLIHPADARTLARRRQGDEGKIGRWPLRAETAAQSTPHDTSAVPPAEIDSLNLTVARAGSLAERGQVASGFMCLAQGLQHARDEEDSGALWGHGLAQLYRQAMEHYARHYGLL